MWHINKGSFFRSNKGAILIFDVSIRYDPEMQETDTLVTYYENDLNDEKSMWLSDFIDYLIDNKFREVNQ